MLTHGIMIIDLCVTQKSIGGINIPKYFSVGQAAKAANITSETLRHYDRIGLVKPSKKDETNGYRYYTEQDIVKINTIRALQQMDLPLQKIKDVLAFDDLQKIIDFLRSAEEKAEEKISLLHHSKAKIQLAKEDYESKLKSQRPTQGVTTVHFPKRVIMLSNTLKAPSLDTLWSYLSHFYNQINPLKKEQFEFEDLAGIYSENGLNRMFAQCIRYEDMDALKLLPEGYYLCANCAEEDRAATLNKLLLMAKENYKQQPRFTVEQVLVSGILQWNYQIQIYIGKTPGTE